MEAKRSMPGWANKLVGLYALKVYSSDTDVRTQQRFYDRFEDARKSAQAAHPNFDLSSDAFFKGLLSAAQAWWRSKPMKGPGVDW